MKKGEIAVVGALCLVAVVMIWQNSKRMRWEKQALSKLESALSSKTSSRTEPVSDAVDAALLLSKLTDPTARQYAARVLGRLGGDKAEARLLEIIESDTDSAARSAAFDALKDSGNDKLGDILLVRLSKGNHKERYEAAKLISNIAVPGMEGKLLSALRNTSGKDYNTRQLRYYLFQALRKIASPAICNELADVFIAETDSNNQDAIAETLVSCSTRQQTSLLTDLLLELPENQRQSNAASRIFKALIKMNDLRATPALIVYLPLKGYSARQARDALINLRDPLAAKALIKYYNAAHEEDQKPLVDALKQRSYPGLTFDAKSKKLTLVSEDEMASLLAERQKHIEKLESRE